MARDGATKGVRATKLRASTSARVRGYDARDGPHTFAICGMQGMYPEHEEHESGQCEVAGNA
jgi:hypothetical protein